MSLDLDDIKFIFKDQLDHKVEKLHLMICEEVNTIIRHPTDDLEGLAFMLSHNFIYDGSKGNIPRFKH